MQNRPPMRLYAGPSLTAHTIALAHELGIQVMDPVKRGDLDALLNDGFKGIAIIADGYFQQVLSIGHAEIRRAIEHEITIYGVSSMGAIRAYEMRDLGMIGYGKVFGYFHSMEDFQDDEVSLLHQDAPPYRAISEPMVHFRYCLDTLVGKGLIGREVADEVLLELKEMWFGDRLMATFRDIFRFHAGVDFLTLVPDFQIYRIKQLDLQQFLSEKVWERIKE